MTNKIKILIIALAAIAVLLIGALVLVEVNSGKPAEPVESKEPVGTGDEVDKNTDNQKPDEDKAQSNGTEGADNADNKTYKPTFMYFVTGEDEERTAPMIEKLKKEYGDRVEFEIRNVDKNPDDLNDFPVDGQMPALIMLDTQNNISDMLLKTEEQERLAEAIEKALSN